MCIWVIFSGKWCKFIYLEILVVNCCLVTFLLKSSLPGFNCVLLVYTCEVVDPAPGLRALQRLSLDVVSLEAQVRRYFVSIASIQPEEVKKYQTWRSEGSQLLCDEDANWEAALSSEDMQWQWHLFTTENKVGLSYVTMIYLFHLNASCFKNEVLTCKQLRLSYHLEYPQKLTSLPPRVVCGVLKILNLTSGRQLWHENQSYDTLGWVLSFDSGSALRTAVVTDASSSLVASCVFNQLMCFSWFPSPCAAAPHVAAHSIPLNVSPTSFKLISHVWTWSRKASEWMDLVFAFQAGFLSLSPLQ